MKTKEVIDTLNEFLETDQRACRSIFDYRTQVNESVQNHETIQVREDSTLGVIGLLNGIIGKSGQPFIAELRDENSGELIGFTEFKIEN